MGRGFTNGWVAECEERISEEWDGRLRCCLHILRKQGMNRPWVFRLGREHSHGIYIHKGIYETRVVADVLTETALH